MNSPENSKEASNNLFYDSFHNESEKMNDLTPKNRI
jgi:hypothetical protein